MYQHGFPPLIKNNAFETTKEFFTTRNGSDIVQQAHQSVFYVPFNLKNKQTTYFHLIVKKTLGCILITLKALLDQLFPKSTNLQILEKVNFINKSGKCPDLIFYFQKEQKILQAKCIINIYTFEDWLINCDFILTKKLQSFIETINLHFPDIVTPQQNSSTLPKRIQQEKQENCQNRQKFKQNQKNERSLLKLIGMSEKIIDFNMENRKMSTIKQNKDFFISNKQINAEVLEIKIYNNNELNTTQKKIQKFYNNFKEATKEQQKNDKISNILRAITIKSERIYDQSWGPIEGGFGVVNKFYSEYSIDKISINQKVNMEAPTCQEVVSGNIVEKASNSDKMASQMLDLEVMILKYLRGFKCEQIGNFFIENIIQQQKVKTIYSPFYEHSYTSKGIKTNTKLRPFSFKQISSFLINFVKGLSFLFHYDVSHRDLKPCNVMICNKKKIMPKIIDFGSSYCSNITPDKGNWQLATSRKYNFIYEEMNKFERQDYHTFLKSDKQWNCISKSLAKEYYEKSPLFDIFALGSFISDLILENYEIRSYFGKYIKNIEWLSAKCRQKNPYRRISQIQVYYFLKLISSILQIKK